jgi:hypothetical protein
VVGISYDSVDVLKEFSDKRKIAFPLLSDPDSKAIKAYGLLDTSAKGKQEGIPYPGTFVVDKEGGDPGETVPRGAVPAPHAGRLDRGGEGSEVIADSRDAKRSAAHVTTRTLMQELTASRPA